MPVLGVDCEMSDLPGDRVDDYAAYLTAGTIGAAGVGPDPERHRLPHSYPPGFPSTLASPASGSAFGLPGRGQPHLAEHSLGQW